MVLAGRAMMNQPCQTDSPSVVNLTLNDLERSIAALSEAVERVFHQTTEVRMPVPGASTLQGEGKSFAEPTASPLVCRLNELRRAINRHTDRLNNLSDEIQL